MEDHTNSPAKRDQTKAVHKAERPQFLLARTLQEVSALLTTQLNLDEVLERLLDLLGIVVRYDSASIQLIGPDGELSLAAGRGYPDIERARQAVHDLSSHILQFQWAVVKIIVIPDTYSNPDWIKFPGTDYIRSWLGAPLLVKGQFIGCLALDSRTPNEYNLAIGETVAAFANQAALAIENTRLFEAERTARAWAEAARQAEAERASELEAVRQATLGLTASLELHQVLDSILISTLTLLPEARNSHIFLYTPEGEGHLTFGAALWSGGIQKRPWSEPRPKGLTATVARQGEAIIVPDLHTHPLYSDVPKDWTGSIIGLPLKIGQRVVGVMNVSYSKPRQFPESELRTLRLLGDQAAIAIENARLFEQAATERRHLALLFDVSRELAASLNPDELLERAVSLTCKALEGMIGEAFIYRPGINRLSLRAIHTDVLLSKPELMHRSDLNLGEGIAGWVSEQRQAVNIPDLTQDLRWLPVLGLDDDARSVLSAPILADGRLLGAISVLHRKPAAFSAGDMALLEAICQSLGLALSNAYQYQQIQRRLAEITLIQTLTQTFNQRLDRQALLNEVTEQLSQRLGYPQIEIFLVEGEQLSLGAYHGSIPQITSLPVSEGILGRVVCQAKPALIPDVTQDAEYIPCIPEIVAELAVPILRGEKVIGVINVQMDQAGLLEAQDLDLLQLLAGQISVALENATLYERVLRHAEDLEQKVALRTVELSELYQLSQEIGYQLSYEDLLRLLVRRLSTATRSEIVVAYLGLSDCHLMVVQTSRPLDPEVFVEIRSQWLSSSAKNQNMDREVEEPAIEWHPGDGFQGQADSIHHIAAFVQAPIVFDHKIVGGVWVGNEGEGTLAADQERLLNTFANQANAAVQRLSAIFTAQQKHLEKLVEHMPVGTLLFDAHFELLVANPLGREILALLGATTTAGVLTQFGPYALQDLVAHQDDPLPIEITLEGPPRRHYATQIRRVSESINNAVADPIPNDPAEWRSLPFYEEGPQWILTVHEVTRERESQARIQSQERLAVVGQLAAGIAHDFNNIMAAILVYADLLRNDPSIASSSRDRLTIIQQQIQRAASLIRQILDFSRRSVMDQSPLDLLPFIKEFDRMLGRVIPETIRLELTYQPGSYWVNADPARLQQVFMNLALNARDAMPNGGTIRFELSRMSFDTRGNTPFPNMPLREWVQIIVKDTGVGISPEVRKHIFEPFFTTKPVGLGTGLGLAQVYGIIKQHDGYIDVQSRVGQGASFIIYLPVLTISNNSDTTTEAQPKLEGHGEQVLVVEDDAATREALKAMMEAHHYSVLTASNGDEALQLYELQGRSITLVVSDLVMPKMGGMALYRELQTRWPEVKILFITGHPLDDDSRTLLEKGNVHWLQKPFNIREFSAAVERLQKKT